MNAHRIVLSVVSGLIALALAVPSPAATPAAPAGPAKTVRIPDTDGTRFERLLKDRDRLHWQLQDLARQAANQIKEGREPIRTYGGYASVRDRLDSVETRLDILSVQNDWTIPPVRNRNEKKKDDEAKRRKSAYAFVTSGRAAALELLATDSRRLLAAIDYRAFLAE